MGLQFITIESETEPQNSILKKRAQDVIFPLAAEDVTSIRLMKAKLYELEGVGLAAPQVGIAKRIALIYIPESAALLREDVRAHPMHVIINPEYEPVGEELKKQDFESCYSVSTIVGKVPRFYTIRLRYQDEDGVVIEKVADGFYARVLQHEIDHLNGILFTDRLTDDCLRGDKASMMKIRREELPEEKRRHFDALVQKKGMIPTAEAKS